MNRWDSVNCDQDTNSANMCKSAELLNIYTVGGYIQYKQPANIYSNEWYVYIF